MLKDSKIYMARGESELFILPEMANRHGLIAGASGTGKTVTLKVMAESFSDMGVPVFLADIKGDLAGMCRPGIDSEKMQQRIARFGIPSFEYKSFPTRFWDVFGEGGHCVRTTISEMGPQLLSRLMNLTDVQTGVLSIVFRIADDKGLLLLDLKDLRSMLQYVGDNRAQFTTEYGSVSTQSIGAIQRALLQLEDEGAECFFGEPALDIGDWMRTAQDGRGYINILHSVKLVQKPSMYATFLLWMLSELFEQLPEVGDPEKPKLVFFFDEAHMLFTGAPKALLEKIVQVVKLIRSKGVGVYFISQSPSDIPDQVLAQLSNRVQHALRAYTPSEQRAVKTAAQTFRANPAFSTEQAITELSVGEALVSFLDVDGRPSMVERAFILPPQSRMGVIEDDERRSVITSSELGGKYDTAIDRESAYEQLSEQEEEASRREALEKEKAELEKEKKRLEKEKNRQSSSGGRRKKSVLSSAAGSVATSFGREIGRTIARGLLGIIKGK